MLSHANFYVGDFGKCPTFPIVIRGKQHTGLSQITISEIGIYAKKEFQKLLLEMFKEN